LPSEGRPPTEKGWPSSSTAGAALGHQVCAVDISATAIERAATKSRERGITVDFVVGDALHLEQLKRTFDTVVDSATFQVLDETERTTYVRGIQNVLVDGGRYLLPASATARRLTVDRAASALKRFVRPLQRDGASTRSAQGSLPAPLISMCPPGW